MAAFLLPMLRYDPEERATAAQMLQHRWLSSQEALAQTPVANGRSGDHHRSQSPSPPSKRSAIVPSSCTACLLLLQSQREY